MNFFQEFFKRLTLPSPDFFKKVQALGVFLIALGGILMLTDVQLPEGYNLPIPPIFPKIGGYLLLAGSVIKAIGKLTVSDPTQLENKQ